MPHRRKPVADKIPLATLEASITAYYDSLSDTEVEEDRLWGEFAGRELAAINPPRDPEAIVVGGVSHSTNTVSRSLSWFDSDI